MIPQGTDTLIFDITASFLYYGSEALFALVIGKKSEKNEPVPKPYGFFTGSWKKRSKTRFFPQIQGCCSKTEVFK
jgi:hypothetical protein